MWQVAILMAVLIAVQAAINYPGPVNLYPSHQPHHRPVNPARDACALVIEGNGRSSLFDHTHSILFGGR